MAVALDCSTALSWCFKDERSTGTARVLDLVATDGAVVPSLWWFELWNALLVGERRGRISPPDVALVLSLMERLPLDTDTSPVPSQVLALGRRFTLSAYDAAYLELAQRRSTPLATLDRSLAASARELDIPVI